MEPYQLTLAEAAEAVRLREVAPSELLGSVLQRIEDVDGRVAAFVGLAVERAQEEARAADDAIAKGGPRGALHGIPVAMKDLYDLAGERTGAGSRERDGHVADADSAVAERLRAASRHGDELARAVAAGEAVLTRIENIVAVSKRAADTPPAAADAPRSPQPEAGDALRAAARAAQAVADRAAMRRHGRAA